MTERVQIHPLPLWARSISERLRPGHPPIFTEGNPTADDRALAAALIAELDEESQRWYGNGVIGYAR